MQKHQLTLKILLNVNQIISRVVIVLAFRKLKYKDQIFH